MTLTPYLALLRLQELDVSSDIEAAHCEADEILCGLVRTYVPHGHEIAWVFDEIRKWYA